MTDIKYSDRREYSDCFGQGVSYTILECWVHNVELALANKRDGTTHIFEVTDE